MTSSYKAALAAAVAAVALLPMSAPASAGGFQGQLRGSMKDTMPVERSSHRPSYAHRCYWRGDVGYSHSTDPSAAFDSPVYAGANPANSSSMAASNENMDGAWMGETGFGCGSGSRGFRADLTIGYRADRDITGNKPDILGVHFPGTFETKVNTLTAMANVYYDFGMMRGFVPYVGFGLGVARHDLSDVSFSLNAGSPVNNLSGSTETNFAWSLMAGAAYQISERTVLDFGYRYIDMGDVTSKRTSMCNTCVAGGSQDRLSVDDVNAHEFKVGLRIHFGGHRPVSYK